MSNNRFDIARIVSNAEILDNPVAAECFFYESEDSDFLDEILEEIESVRERLPEGVNLLDLRNTYCGNTKTRIIGLATCSATNGHGILNVDACNRVIFGVCKDAFENGYRPCKRCMKEAYAQWVSNDRHNK